MNRGYLSVALLTTGLSASASESLLKVPSLSYRQSYSSASVLPEFPSLVPAPSVPSAPLIVAEKNPAKPLAQMPIFAPDHSVDHKLVIIDADPSIDPGIVREPPGYPRVFPRADSSSAK